MSIDQLSALVKDFADERDWEQFHSLRNLILALQGELGELAEIVQWTSDSQIDEEWIRTKRGALQDEIADVFIYLLRLATVSGIDLEAATLHKIEKNRDRYPVSLSRGSARKYNELGELNESSDSTSGES